MEISTDDEIYDKNDVHNVNKKQLIPFFPLKYIKNIKFV